MTSKTDDVICIIGMHRSGTSMVTRLLHSCGLDLGNPDEIYLDSLDDNKGGHYEHKRFHQLNESLLTHFAGAWDNPPNFAQGWEYDPTLGKLADDAKSLLKTFDTGQRWGWKDPRTTLLLPFWTSLLPNLRFVICVRNPLEVAQSLAQRDRMPIEAGMQLWYQYMQAALRDTAVFPRIITFYEDFFNDPLCEAQRLIEFCGLPAPDNLSEITQIVSPTLKHQHATVTKLLNTNALLDKHKLFYLGLRALATTTSADKLTSESVNKFLKLFEDDTNAHQALIENLQNQLQKQHYLGRLQTHQIEQMNTSQTEMTAFLTELRHMHKQQHHELQEQQQLRQETEAQLNQLKIEHETLSQQQEESLAQEQHKNKLAQEKIGELCEQQDVLTRQLADLQQLVEQKRAELDEAAQEVTALQHLVQEKDEAVTQVTDVLSEAEQKVSALQHLVQEKDKTVNQVTLEHSQSQQSLNAIQTTLSQRESELREIEVSYNDTQRQFSAVQSSRGYRMLMSYWQLADRLLPINGKRRKTAESVMRLPQLLTWQNVSSIFKQVRLYGPSATYRGATTKVKDAVSGQVDVIQPQMVSNNGHLTATTASVSVIIPVKNAGAEFKHLLTQLANQQGFAKIELVIVDSGSTDESVTIAESFGATVVHMPPDEFSHADARNIGADQATGDYLLFTVQDALPPSDRWLASLMQTMQREQVTAVSCTETPRPDADLFYKAGVWQYGRFLQIDKHDRILRMPEQENHLTLRKNSALSDIACLITRSTFMQYKFQGAYAEDLDLGLRLIRDGHQLALLGSTKIIHSHNRPPYAHLKRGYVDELTLAELLPDRPVLATDANGVFRDLAFVYHLIQTKIMPELAAVTSPCKPRDLVTAVIKPFRAAAKEKYPNQIDLTNNPYLDQPFTTFLQSIADQHQHSSQPPTYNGTLLQRMQDYTMLIIDYLNNHETMIDEQMLADFQHSLYKAYAFLSGTYLASCYTNGSDETKSILQPLHQQLTANETQPISAAPAPAPAAANANGTATYEPSSRIVVTSTMPPANGHMTDEHRARMIAIYLPQFHPTPENNEWWGEGFTEWTNVTKSVPLFQGHYQPHLPANLGFYDLRLPETRQLQANLARQYGIEGFCYYHYWFNGQRLLERPFNEVLASGKPDFPFCLAWANETWSRRWLGEEKSILIKQDYSAEDDLNHARWLVNVLADPRNIRVQGRPLYLIYRPTHLPDAQRTTDILRETCLKQGVTDPFLLGINAHAPDVDYRKLGFDGTMNFEPWLGALPDVMDDSISQAKLARNLKLGIASKKLKIYDYVAARQKMLAHKKPHPVYPSIFVGWDNSPRRGDNGIIMVNSSPEHFETGLTDMVASMQHKPFDDRLLFINAWNEWAEGNHLEPDRKHGLGYLEAVKRANVIQPSLEKIAV